MLKSLWNGLCDLVYPPRCFVCKNRFATAPSDGLICSPCRQSVIRNVPPFCPKCSRRLVDFDNPKCRQCTKTKFKFDFAWAACLYADPLKDMLCRFKYSQKTHLRKPLAGFMTDFLDAYHLDVRQFDVIVPIPLHPIRLRERGYNQSLLLAQQIGKPIPIELSTGNLVRSRNTRHQTLLGEKERWTNIRGAFRIKHPAGFSGKNVLITDDLLTTGATASEAALTLKEAGAKTVGVFTLAITV